MEDDAVLLVNGADEITEFAPEHAFQRPAIRRHDMNVDFPCPQRRSNLEPDEACAEHDRAPRLLCFGDDRARIGERAQQVDMRLIGAGDIEANRFRPGSKQQLVERHASSTRKRDLPRLRIDPGDLGAKLKLDRLVLVELERSKSLSENIRRDYKVFGA